MRQRISPGEHLQGGFKDAAEPAASFVAGWLAVVGLMVCFHSLMSIVIFVYNAIKGFHILAVLNFQTALFVS